MSTALHDPSHFGNEKTTPGGSTSQRHLQPVAAAENLRIRPISTFPTTNIRHLAQLNPPLRDPVDEYQPAKTVTVLPTPGFIRRPADAPRKKDVLYVQQHEAMKKMTQTIGAAFIEAELGIRPYMQLSTWLELELFQKLRWRVEQSVNGKYLAARSGETDSKKVPSVVPLGVRATRQSNGDWETSMTIRVGERARAIAMRLKLHRERWQVIALEVG